MKNRAHEHRSKRLPCILVAAELWVVKGREKAPVAGGGPVPALPQATVALQMKKRPERGEGGPRPRAPPGGAARGHLGSAQSLLSSGDGDTPSEASLPRARPLTTKAPCGAALGGV